MNFSEAIGFNNLGQQIEAQYGTYGHFTQESADAIWQAATLENTVATRFKREILAAATAVTLMNESVFNLRQQPNTNKNDANWWNFDIGPMQLNLGWTVRMTFQQEMNAFGLKFTEVFGQPPFVANVPFTGVPIANLRMGARRLLARNIAPKDTALIFADTIEMQVVCYTGEANRVHRQQDWRKYKEPFVEFFKRYYE